LKSTITPSTGTGKPVADRRVYAKPVLQAKGSIAELTKAVSSNSANNYDAGGFPNFYS
jgi:hypothetical protein